MTRPDPPHRSPPPHSQADSQADSRADSRADFEQQIQTKSQRKLKARREGDRSLWFGLGFSGLVGWSVAMPTLLGIAAGVWIDRHWPSRYSWTLMLMLIGLLLGCLSAWYWVQHESRDR